MTPLWDGLKNATDIVDAGNTSFLTSIIRQLADRMDEEANFMEEVQGQVGSLCHLTLQEHHQNYIDSNALRTYPEQGVYLTE